MLLQECGEIFASCFPATRTRGDVHNSRELYLHVDPLIPQNAQFYSYSSAVFVVTVTVWIDWVSCHELQEAILQEHECKQVGKQPSSQGRQTCRRVGCSGGRADKAGWRVHRQEGVTTGSEADKGAGKGIGRLAGRY